MNPCDRFQPQLLDYLYDLLEPAETEALAEHLKGCGSCEDALRQAQGHKQRLAAAAKLSFPEVRFGAAAFPVATGVRPAGAAVRPAPAWGRWAVAAVVLLAVGGIGFVNNTYWQKHDEVQLAQAQVEALQKDLQQLQEAHQTRLVQARRELHAVQTEEHQLAQEQTDRLAKIDQDIARRTLHMAVSGPPVPEAGALNEYQVQVYDLTGRGVPAQISAEVRDVAQKEVVCRVPVRAGPQPGYAQLTLPSDLPIKPNRDLSLVVSAKGDDGVRGQLTENLKLAAPVLLTHLATDKPMYQPGEVVYFRSLTLERFSLKPPADDLQLVYSLTTPRGETTPIQACTARLLDEKTKHNVLGPDQQPVRGIGAGEYRLDPAAPGGEYTLTVSEVNHHFPPQQRKFLVNEYAKPRLNKELEFTKKSYGPGDDVVAACKVARAESRQPLANSPATATLKVDGRDVATRRLRTDVTGGVQVKMKLPGRIERGIGTLSVAFTDGANVETITRPVPIVLKKLQVDFYPEGGDLVAGVPNRVYFQARTMLDKPAELVGRIVDDQGQTVAGAQTFNDPTQPGANQGMGLFELTPLAGRKYELQITSPAGIEGKYFLPQVKPDGVVLTIPHGVTTDGEPIRVVVRGGKEQRHLLVGAYCRGLLMAHQRVTAPASQPVEVDLKPEGGVGGVYRVTVFEEQGLVGNQVQLAPRAERLVYRVPAHRLSFTVRPDKSQYAPGDRVTLHYEAADENGRPASAVAMVAVVDKSVLKLADEKTFRTMPTHFLLTTEVRRPEDLEYADFLLSDHPRAAQALDLLLGTQGWRRFAEQQAPAHFQQKEPVEANRLLLAMQRISADTQANKVVNFDQTARQQVLDETSAKLTALNERRLKAQAEQEAAQAEGGEFAATIAQLGKEIAADQQHYREAASSLEEYQAFIRRGLVPVLALALLAGCILSLVVGLFWSGRAQLMPCLATAACSLLLFGLVIAFEYRTAGPRGSTDLQISSLDTEKEYPTSKTAGVAQLTERAVEPTAAPPQALEQAKGAHDPKGELDRTKRPGAPLPAMAAPRAMKPEAAAGDAGKPRTFMRKREDLDAKQGDKALAGEGKGAANRGMRNAGVEAETRGAADDQFRRAKDAERDEQQLRLREDPARRAADGREKQAEALQKKAPQADLNYHLGVPATPPAVAGAAAPLPVGRGGPAGPVGAPNNLAGGFGGGIGGIGGFQGQGGQNFGFAGGFGGMPGAQFQNAKKGERRANGVFTNVAMPPPPPPPCLVRVYAHARTSAPGAVRTDYTETLYWNPVLVLADGKGESSFQLCDSVTTFQVLVAGNTLDGRLGSATAEVEAKKPLTLEPKLPMEITANDRVDVPLAIANSTDTPQAVRVQVQAANLSFVAKSGSDATLPPNGRRRQLYGFQAKTPEGEAQLRFDGHSGAFTDSVVRTFRVVPEGFPVVGTQSDLLEKTARHQLVLPDSWVPGTLNYQVAVYPSTLADLQKGLEALLREPNGCFEQTSTSNYPNLLILDYLRETDQAKPELTRRAQDLLARGYQKLTSFECQNPSANRREGYEWFGGAAPPHEALTAYGLLEFRDMARVYDVDKAMLERTRTYLMSRKDGKGGFLRNPRAIDTFGRAPDDITNAYIVWALTESGKEDDVTRELNALAAQAQTSTDPYFLALVANSLESRGRTAEALTLLKKLAEAQKPDGHLEAQRTSITGSGGRDLYIETTSLTLLAWLKAQRPEQLNPPIQAAVKWIGKQRGGYGGFGSTQSTILALKALIAYAKANKRTAEAGELVLYVGDEPVVRRAFPAGVEEALVLELPDAQKRLKAGANHLRVEITGKSVFPYTATWSYRTLKPVSPGDCPVRLKTSLDRTAANEGETVGLSVEVQNANPRDGQAMTVAIIGLPAGLTLPEDMKQLADLARLRNNGTERGPIDAWEVRGRELVLYWRDLAPGKKIDVHLELICRVPGEYRGPASRAYLYYNADHKCWVAPLQMTIKPAAE